MTSTCTHVPSAVARIAAVAVVAAALSTITIAPAAAKPAKDRSAKASTTVQDVSGLEVVRTWKVAADDPGTLTTVVHVRNTNTAPVTTTILEPLPTNSLKKAKFAPKKVPVTQMPGLARVDVTVPSGGEFDFGYTATLTKDRKANAHDRLTTVQGEMQTTLESAQATDADRAIAGLKDRYIGIMRVTEETATGVEFEGSEVAQGATIILRLTAPPFCRVAGRHCRFTAQDSYTGEPKLAALEPMGNSLVATGAADLAQSGMTCGGAEEPGVMTKSWAFEPNGWRLTWSGWEVSQGQYTIVGDLTSPANGRCVSAAVHKVTTGLMTG